MLDKNSYIKLTKIIFFVVGLLHLLRLFMGWTLVINGIEVPMWASIIGTVVAWYIAYSGYKLIHK